MKKKNKRWPASPRGVGGGGGDATKGEKMERVRDRQGGCGGEVRGEGLAGRFGAENGIGAYCSVTLSI